MQTLLRLVLVFSAGLVLGADAFGKPWRGIVPYRSTREDLIKAFGQSPDANEIRANYYVDGEHAYIVFSTHLTYYPECASKLPTDTVMVVEVTPKRNTPLSYYEKDLSRFRVTDAGIGYTGYIDEKEGLAYVVTEDYVDMVYYFASAEDNHLCPRYADDPERFIYRIVDFHPTMDEFGVILWADERARLMNFAIQLQNATKSKGYIIIYPGGKIGRKAAEARGKRAINYLNAKWKFGKERLEMIVGPKRDDFSVELSLYPKDVAPYVRSKTP